MESVDQLITGLARETHSASSGGWIVIGATPFFSR